MVMGGGAGDGQSQVEKMLRLMCRR